MITDMIDRFARPFPRRQIRASPARVPTFTRVRIEPALRWAGHRV
jgi:hypothetical protein